MTDKLNYAGDFSIEKAEIITSSGQIIYSGTRLKHFNISNDDSLGLEVMIDHFILLIFKYSIISFIGISYI